jgi:hypothetical protein
MRAAILLLSLLAGTACHNGGDDYGPPAHVTGLRVLAIKAEPPEIAAGQSSVVTALAVDTQGRSLTASWTRCLGAPDGGVTLIVPARVSVLPDATDDLDCFNVDSAAYLQPLGRGLTVDVIMPDVPARALGAPDRTGGVYLPLRTDVSAGSDSITATYHLRLATESPPNRNPRITGVVRVTAEASDGGVTAATPLDDAHPVVVHAGDSLTLRLTVADGSAETYSANGQSLTEYLVASWFATAGTWMKDVRPPDADAVLLLDQLLPPSGSAVAIWAVLRDGRGGVDYVERKVRFQ